MALVVAGVVAFPVNRWLITRGKGHAVLHETGIHGGPPTRVVAVVAAAATALSFAVLDGDGMPVRDYEVEHEKRMHLIVVRRDLTGFQDLHARRRRALAHRPRDRRRGPLARVRRLQERRRESTLASDLAVDGPLDSRPLSPAQTTADAGDGYEVALTGGRSKAGEEAEEGFEVTRDGRPVLVEDYLGAKGHLVALARATSPSCTCIRRRPATAANRAGSAS